MDMAKNTEIELKLLVDKDNLKKLLKLDCVVSALREGSCQKRKLVSSYYDTEDLAFKRHGIAYRVRSKGDGSYEATVKTSVAKAAGLSERVELNLPLPKAQPVLEGFAAMGLGYELSELAPTGVSKLFTVTVQRTTYILDLPGAVAELAVDHGKLTAGKAVDKIDEVEIELLEGDKGALFKFAAAIAAQVPVFVEKRSKFVRGLALRGISVDAQPLQEKLGNGDLKAELLAGIAYHGEQLFALKNDLENNISEKVLKALKRELLALRCLTAVVGIAKCELLEQMLDVVEQVRCLLGLQVLWQRILLKGQQQGRTSMQKKLADATLDAITELQLYAGFGRFTALIFVLTSMVYEAELPEVAFDAHAKAALKQWQQELAQKPAAANAEDEADKMADTALAEAELNAQKLNAAENICALARCCNLKGAAKASEAVKKQRRQLNKQAVLLAWRQRLAAICEGSTSKLVYREAGMILGYLLAKA